ncbi:MAG: hypothetical protein LUG25_05155, partial [Oscillospiraceae bacterium]|nr:hypothetical protein [Oscillospiraceae bacterium]
LMNKLFPFFGLTSLTNEHGGVHAFRLLSGAICGKMICVKTGFVPLCALLWRCCAVDAAAAPDGYSAGGNASPG